MASFVIENRILAGIQFEDIATGTPVRVPLDVRGVEGGVPVKVQPNRRGIYVITAAQGLEAHTAAFAEPPDTPPLGDVTVELEVRDPSGVYLPRQFSVVLPRAADPELPNPVHQPVEVSLLRSPRAERSQNWAMVRVQLRLGDSDTPLPAALLRVVHDPGGDREVLGWGMSVVADPRARQIERRSASRSRWVHFSPAHIGEASVPVVGLSDQVWSEAEEGDVLLSDIPATLEVLPMSSPAGRLPDPDAFFGAAPSGPNSRNILLSVGAEHHAEPFAVTILTIM